jgi:hypothetical protein
LKLSAALVCLNGVVLAASFSAAAAPVAHTPSTAVERLHIVLVGETRGHGLDRLFAEWLEPSGLDVTVVESPALDAETVFVHDQDANRIRIWLTLPRRELARLTFADPRAERFLVRDVALEGSLDELGREALAQVLVAAAQAFRERRESTPRDEVRRTLEEHGEKRELDGVPVTAKPGRDRASSSQRPRAEPSPPTSPSELGSSTPRLRWAPGVRYALRIKGPEGVSHALGALLEGGMEWSAARLGLAAEARYEFPTTAESDEIALWISSRSLHLGAVGELRARESHGWLAEMGVGFERVSIEARATADGDVQPRADVRDDRALVYGGFGPYFRWASVRVVFGLRLDVPLAKTHYDVVTDGEAAAVLTPWQFQPGAFVTAAWD